MKQNENVLKIKGIVHLSCIGPDGKLKWTDGGHNIITNTGKAAAAARVGGIAFSGFNYLEVGTSSVAAAATQTRLCARITDSGLARVTATVSRVTSAQTNDTLRLAHTWSVSGTKTIEEIGVFNNASSATATMLARKVTGSKAVSIGDSLVATYDIIFS